MISTNPLDDKRLTLTPKVRVSERLAELIGDLLQRHGLSYAGATVRVGGRISRGYWGTMRSGIVPSREKLEIIAEAFPDEDLTELFEAAGYVPPKKDSLETLASWNETVEQVARRRNLPPEQVLPTLLDEELARLDARNHLREQAGV